MESMRFPEEEERTTFFIIEVFAAPTDSPDSIVLGLSARTGMPPELLPTEIKELLDETVLELTKKMQNIMGSTTTSASARGPGVVTERITEYLKEAGIDVAQPRKVGH